MMFDDDRFIEWLEDNLDFTARTSRTEWHFTCPFCGGSEFYVNVVSGKWLCFHERNCGRRSQNPAVLVSEVDGSTVEAARAFLLGEEEAVSQKKIDAFLDNEYAQVAQPAQAATVSLSGQEAGVNLYGMEYLAPGSNRLHNICVEHILGRGFDCNWFMQNYAPLVGTQGRMSNRLILPHWRDGFVIFYQGRLVVDDSSTEDFEPPKYLNPKNEEQKIPRRHLLWNENRLLNPGSVLVVTEGIFKAIAFEKLGYSCVATYGSMVSEEQRRQLIFSSPDAVVLAPDRGELDPGLQRSTGMRTFYDLWREKLAKPMVSAGRRVLMIVPPEHGDYDEVESQCLLDCMSAARPITSKFSI